jgi:hypothetical protein
MSGRPPARYDPEGARRQRLDAGAAVTIEQIDPDTWAVADDGPGLDREKVVRLFAVNRPMTSTKLVRRPTRGAIGNGLRVVTGGALASGGMLTVESRRARYVLDVDRSTGETAVVEESPSDVVTGMRVTVAFGPALSRSADDGWMARLAARCAGAAAKPMRSSPAWYDPASFAELIHAAVPGTTVADIAALLGIELEDDRPATEANLALLKARAGNPPVLVPLGDDRFSGRYAREQGMRGEIPVLAEAWIAATRCPASRGGGRVRLIANRSPVAAEIRIKPSSDGGLAFFGGNVSYVIGNTSPGAAYEITLAVTAPLIPVTTEGKEPDLKPLWHAIEPALAKAMRAAYRSAAQGEARRGDIKDACYAVMPEAYLKASGGDKLPANARQIYYSAAEFVEKRYGSHLVIKDDYFTKTLLPAYIIEHGLEEVWDVVFDARGQLREPHTGKIVPVGTLRVRDYLEQRELEHPPLLTVDAGLYPTNGPENRFKTLLYIEKKGFDALIQKARIQERFDLTIMSTEGNSVTAARKIADRHAQQGVTVLVAHDFDRSGACIAYTFGHDTWRHKFEVPPNVIDLGLSLEEAREMGLQDQAAPDGGPGEDTLREYGRTEEEIDFLIRRRRRYELNAMPADVFVKWLERKLEEHGAGKVVPSAEIVERHARRVLARRLIEDRIAPLIAEVEAAAADVALPRNLVSLLLSDLVKSPALAWDQALESALAEYDVTPEAGLSPRSDAAKARHAAEDAVMRVLVDEMRLRAAANGEAEDDEEQV